MTALSTAKIIRRVRQRLEVSQEGLSRLLNATKGAIQHWERGRNNPDLARLLALRQLCPAGPERKELEALIRQVQAHVAPIHVGAAPGKAEPGGVKGPALPSFRPNENLVLLRRENMKLRKQVEKLHAVVERRNERLRILEGVCSDLEREAAQNRPGSSGKPPVQPPPQNSPA